MRSKELIMKNCPTSMCHASTLIKINDDKILCAWFGGSKEGNSDVGIWISSRENNVWSSPIQISKENQPHWNPVFFRIDDEKILLFYKLGEKIRSWQTMVSLSCDNGKAWGEPHELVLCDKGGRGPVRNKPIRLSNGRIIAPASLEDGNWSSFVDISDDNGKTWAKSQGVFIENLLGSRNERTVSESEIPVSEQSFYGRGVIQPTLWESSQGKAHMLLRSTEGKIFRSDSEDFGESWTSAYPTELPNNNSGIDLVKLKNGDIYLVSNPVGENWGKRTPISLDRSQDNGQTWERICDLETQDGEFAYPAIITDENMLYISYTHKRENVAFWKISI
ncbi:MAG: sialidase family protein [Oscillospiraceae bacterium]|jgi:predicted neuraminidase